MKKKFKNILEEILRLLSMDRAIIVERMLQSFYQPNAKIDESWKEEVEKRIRAFEAGKIKTVDFEDIIIKYN